MASTLRAHAQAVLQAESSATPSSLVKQAVIYGAICIM
jgi:hypothetical protein